MYERDRVLSFRVSEAEREAIMRAARAMRRTAGDFTRVTVLAVAEQLRAEAEAKAGREAQREKA
jgi:uncharacterized protein (DUF1778 family)